jgi:hypothetical protein
MMFVQISRTSPGHQQYQAPDGLGLLNREDAFLAEFGHGIGHQLSDFLVIMGGDGGDLLPFLIRCYRP